MAAAESAARLGRHLLDVVEVDILEWRSEAAVPAPPQVADAAVQRLDAEDDRLRELLPRRLDKAAKSYLRRGDRGYVATVGGVYAGWLWVSRVSHRDPWSGLRFRLAPDEAYAYAMWVEPERRHLGLGAVLFSTLLADVVDEGSVKRVYGWVDAGNREMQMLIRLVFGFRQVQRVRRARLLHLAGFQVPWSADPPEGPVSRRGRHSGGA